MVTFIGKIKLLFLVIGVIWGMVYFANGVFHGSWFMIFPLLGLLWGMFFVFKVLALLVKYRESLNDIWNIAQNFALLLETQQKKDPKNSNEMIRKLILPPEEFKKRMECN